MTATTVGRGYTTTRTVPTWPVFGEDVFADQAEFDALQALAAVTVHCPHCGKAINNTNDPKIRRSYDRG